MRPDLFSARIAGWAYVDSVRYYSPEANALKTVEAENDALYSISLGIRNHTDTTTSNIPVPSDFELYVDKETYSVIDKLPGGVQWSQLRQRPDAIDIDPPDGHYSDEMDGGVDGYIDVAFDAPVMDSFAVKWNWSTGSESGTKWLLPPK